MERIIFTNAVIATMRPSERAYGLIEHGALAMDRGQIAWQGNAEAIPAEYGAWTRQDVAGRLITPGLIDCHTHIVHAGNRAQEFEMRLTGATYEEIARNGGGIVSTVNATRAASEEALCEAARPRLADLMNDGVTTVEIKSGYGLDVETELKMLRAARRLGDTLPVRVVATFLGAHALPPEYAGQADAYIDEAVLPAMEQAAKAGLVDAVDGFCESIGFSPVQIERVFQKAKTLGIPVKLHAEQLSNLGGAALAARYGALSADHLEYLDNDGVTAMAQSGTVAVILPGAYYFLRDTQPPPIESLRVAGVPMAVATDCNPGSSPMSSLLLAMNMACTLFYMSPEEALAGTTVHAAKALGLHDTGSLAPGLRADLAIWNAEHPAELSYRFGNRSLHQRYFGGLLC